MRTLIRLSLLTILLAATTLGSVPALPAPAAAAIAQEDGEESDEGNDRDGQGEGEQVQASDAYTVEVECTYDDGANQSECTYAGVAQEGAKNVSHVDVPEEEVCAEVLGGDYEYVDPDPNTRVVGYKSRGSEGTLSLVLAGEVTTAGTATYWIKSGDGVFPASGAGLACGDMVAREPAEPTTPQETSVVSDGTGAVIIHTLTCVDVPKDMSAFDWFGACAPDENERQLTLTELTGGSESLDQTTGATGEAVFGSLAPGSYRLELADASWCHAESDSVTSESEVVVKAGVRSNVWIFLCEGQSGV